MVRIFDIRFVIRSTQRPVHYGQRFSECDAHACFARNTTLCPVLGHCGLSVDAGFRSFCRCWLLGIAHRSQEAYQPGRQCPQYRCAYGAGRFLLLEHYGDVVWEDLLYLPIFLGVAAVLVAAGLRVKNFIHERHESNQPNRRWLFTFPWDVSWCRLELA